MIAVEVEAPTEADAHVVARNEIDDGLIIANLSEYNSTIRQLADS